jgi:SCY1-like protein 2
LNLDYTSPDFVMDGNVTAAADMFSLGLLILALYNSPHRSPLEFNGSQSAYKRAFSSSSSVPNKSNNFMCSQALPKEVTNGVLDQLITRRPAQRLDARGFQQARYFDNILVSTIRFLDSLPAKTPNEKSQFMRGLPRILNQFPKSVLEKKVLPALLEETKDRELLALVLQNVFKIIQILPAGKRAFTERVIPKLRETFLSGAPPAKGSTPERDSLKEAGLMVVLENIFIAAESSGGKDFKDGKPLLRPNVLAAYREELLGTDIKDPRYTPHHQLRLRISYTFASRCCATYTTSRVAHSRFFDC